MKKYWFIFQTQLINSLAYPGELIGRALTILPFMWIFYQLWSVTFASTGQTEMNGLTLKMTMWYFVVTEVIEISRPRVGNTISETVRDGSIAYLLSKPYNFMLYHYATAMGGTIFHALFNILFGGGMIWWLVGAPPSLMGVAMVLPALLGAWALHFCIAALIGLLAFIVEDISAFLWIFQKAAFVFGGLLIPLDFYPGWMRTIANFLPFASLSYAPARLFISPSPQAFFAVIGQQILWLGILGLALTFFYHRAVRFLTINGG